MRFNTSVFVLISQLHQGIFSHTQVYYQYVYFLSILIGYYKVCIFIIIINIISYVLKIFIICKSLLLRRFSTSSFSLVPFLFLFLSLSLHYQIVFESSYIHHQKELLHIF